MAKTKGKPAQIDAYAQVTDRILELLESGTAPWRKPWNSGGMPKSLSSGKEYRGINPFLLSMTAQSAGYSSPFWGTFEQLKQRGGMVRKGEKGTRIIFWKHGEFTTTDAETGENVVRESFLLRQFVVFNAEQSQDGLTVPETDDKTNDAAALPIDKAEALFMGYFGRKGAPKLEYGGHRAFYRPGTDSVHIPNGDQFHSAEERYSTVFHEMTHSTGAESRLKRNGIIDGHRFGDELYSKEELIAEMGAAMLCGLSGIDQVTFPNSAAYLASWLKVLRGDSKLIVQAAAGAQKAADHIRGVSHAKETPASAAGSLAVAA